MASTTELLNSTSPKALNSGSWGLRPTERERRMGRFLRGPDAHPADPAPADPAPSDPADPPADPAPADPSLMNPAPADPADPADPNDDGENNEPQLPEKYELTPPEGFEISDEIVAEVDPVFRELGLNNDQANKLMPLAASFAERIMQQQTDAFQAQATAWAKEAKNDPEIGKGNWPETEALVAKALDRFVGPAVTKGEDGKDVPNPFRKLLDDTKLGNHPAMIRAFRAIGEQLGEGGEFVRSDTGAQVKRSREEVLYGTAE